MSATGSFGASSRLRRLAQSIPVGHAPEERCDICAAAIAPTHRHLIDLATRTFRCACRACALLFDRSTAGGGHYRLLPERYREVADLALDDDTWGRLRIPVDTAFLFHSTPAARVLAFYPSPMGPMESRLDLGAWGDVVAANPEVRRHLTARRIAAALEYENDLGLAGYFVDRVLGAYEKKAGGRRRPRKR